MYVMQIYKTINAKGGNLLIRLKFHHLLTSFKLGKTKPVRTKNPWQHLITPLILNDAFWSRALLI